MLGEREHNEVIRKRLSREGRRVLERMFSDIYIYVSSREKCQVCVRRDISGLSDIFVLVI
jgi:hypothetical protein